MKIEQFIPKFAELFEDTDTSNFEPQTQFRSLDEWSSLIGLSVIAMADEEYNVKLKGDDIRNAQTIEDIFNVIKSRV